jgi:hypothetical protein
MGDERGTMGTARDPDLVKLIASLLTGRFWALEEAKAALAESLGALDFQSALIPFDHTDYYAAEMGSGLVRQIVTFERLVPPARLPAIKLLTNGVEQRLAEGGRRVVNIDPGYVSLAKLVLASTKDHGHRLYLDRGIYGEVTLSYQGGRFRPWPWSYPDYASDGYCSLFGQIRERYKQQLRG